MMDNEIKISEKKNAAKFEKLLCWLYSSKLWWSFCIRCMVFYPMHGVSGPVLVTD